MSDLVVISYPAEGTAAEVVAVLTRLRSEYMIDLDDYVYVTKDVNGNVHLHQAIGLTSAGAVSGAAGGAFWGALIGLFFFAPLAGAAIGAAAGGAAGAVVGHFSDYGINDDFIKGLGAQLQNGTSAVFVLFRNANPDKVLPEIAKYGGTVLKTSLTNEGEARLRQALAQLAPA
jgi:uncharacterized membrane protein